MTNIICTAIIILAVEKTAKNVRVAQLDRASGYGPEGREFESCHVHEKKHLRQAGAFLFSGYSLRKAWISIGIRLALKEGLSIFPNNSFPCEISIFCLPCRPDKIIRREKDLTADPSSADIDAVLSPGMLIEARHEILF